MTDLNVTPITACHYCPRKFADEAARWQHMEQIHGVGASERLQLTQGAEAAVARLQDILERLNRERGAVSR